MKTNILVLSSLLSLGAAAAFAGDGFERVSESQLPPRVRHSFEEQSHGERIRDVRVQTINGRMVYEIDTGRDGGRIIRIAADGEVLRSTIEPRNEHEHVQVYERAPAPVAVIPAPVTVVRVDDLPVHVRERLEHDHHGRRVSRVTRETIEGRAAFGIQFGDGTATVFFGEDGTVIRR